MWKAMYMKQEDFLISQAVHRGFVSETDRNYIEFPEYSWCTHNYIDYDRILYCARNEISGCHCYLSLCSFREFICEFYNIQMWFLCALFQ